MRFNNDARSSALASDLPPQFAQAPGRFPLDARHCLFKSVGRMTFEIDHIEIVLQRDVVRRRAEHLPSMASNARSCGFFFRFFETVKAFQVTLGHIMMPDGDHRGGSSGPACVRSARLSPSAPRRQ